MFEKLWINGIHPSLKELVLDAAERGASVSRYGETVEIKTGPYTVRCYDAETGELIMRN
jgi:hypothetical protein